MKGLCEICGSDKYEVSAAIFEGTRVLACVKCIKTLSLTPIKPKSEVERRILKEPVRRKASKAGARARLIDEYAMVEGYGRVIKSAREARKLSFEDLTRLINEKVSVLKNVEGEKIIPPPDLIRKLEHHLRVKILEKVGDEPPLLDEPLGEIKRPSLGEVAVFRESGEEEGR